MSNAESGRALPDITDADVDAVLEKFSGDPREAIRALLYDIDVLAGDRVSSVSLGFVRGAPFPPGLRWRGQRS